VSTFEVDPSGKVICNVTPEMLPGSASKAVPEIVRLSVPAVSVTPLGLVRLTVGVTPPPTVIVNTFDFGALELTVRLSARYPTQQDAPLQLYESLYGSCPSWARSGYPAGAV